MKPRIRPAGDRALLIEAQSRDETEQLLHALSASPPRGVTEIVAGARTVLAVFDPLMTDAASVAAAVRVAKPSAASAAEAASHELRVRYDGPDLTALAAELSCSVDALAGAHAAAEWTAEFLGFAPGFAYLMSDDWPHRVPRLDTPRPSVAAGAVAVAGERSAVYPQSSPGGWQLIGHSDAALFDVDRSPPALIAAGDRVRFTPVRELVRASEQNVPSAQSLHRGRSIMVEQASMQTTLQDAGRSGMAAQGIPRSGALDQEAMRRANLIVGNDPDSAVLETAGTPCWLRAVDPVVVAVTGAAERVWHWRGDQCVAITEPRAIALYPGDQLEIPAPVRGVRSCAAVRGGFAAPQTLGSSSTDTLSGLGPPIIGSGTLLPLNEESVATASVSDARLPGPRLPAPGELVTLRILLGPRDDALTPEALRLLTEQEWTVRASSDRVAVRLEGERPLVHVDPDSSAQLPSEGVVTGSLQVPPSGQPVAFLADHPATGGYPVAAVVAEDHLDLLGQLPAGVRVRLEP